MQPRWLPDVVRIHAARTPPGTRFAVVLQAADGTTLAAAAS
jgi:hypothetical protein